MPLIAKAARVTLAQQVRDGLRAFIADARLSPGEVLPSETKLAAQFGVSRPVIREALQALAATGLVEIVNGKGAVVRPIDSAPLRTFFERAVQLDRTVAVAELMEVRCGIEVQAAALAAQRIVPAQLETLGATVEQMRTALADTDRYNDLDLDFHLRIAAATQNTMIVHLMESIRGTLQETIREGLRRRRTSALRKRGLAFHEQLVVALGSGDPAAARAAMQAHFDDAIALLGPSSGSGR